MGIKAVQVGLHLLKGAIGLSKEVVDDRLAEIALVFVIVHLEDLNVIVRNLCMFGF